MPPELLAQFTLLEDGLRALGVTVWPMVDQEADDGLAAAARVARDDDRVGRVFICTVDKDLGQCVEDPKVVQLDRRKGGRPDRRGRRAGALRRRPGIDPRLPRAGRRQRRRLPRPPGLGCEVDRHRARALRARRRDPRRRARVDGRGARRGQARGDARRRHATRPRCSSTSRRCAPTPTSAPSTTGSGEAPCPSSRRWRPASAPTPSWPAASDSRRSASHDRDRIETRPSGPTVLGARRRPRRRRARAAAARLPRDVLRVAGPARGAGGRGLPRGRARPTGLRGRRAAGRARGLRRSTGSSTTCSGSPTRSVSTASTSSATTGVASWPGTRQTVTAPASEPRLRTLTVVSTPHPAPFEAAKHSGGDQAAALELLRVVPQSRRRVDLARRRRRAAHRRLRRAPGRRRRGVPARVHRRRRRRAHRRPQLVPGQHVPRPRRARSPRPRSTCGRPTTWRWAAKPAEGTGAAGRRGRTASRCSTA